MELADLEYYYLAKELDGKLKEGRIRKIYQISSSLFKIVVDSKKGKHALVFKLPDYATISKKDVAAPERPSNFSMALRKKIANGVVQSVEQPGFERIIEIDIAAKGEMHRLIVELFSKGNVLLCNKDGVIELLYRREEWKDRSLKRGGVYKHPPSKETPFNIGMRHIKLNGKKTLMAGILSVVSLAPKYLEEAFARAGIEPRADAELSEHDKVKLIDAIGRVCREANFVLYKKEGEIAGYGVCELSRFADCEKEHFDSISELIDKVYEPRGQIKAERSEKKELVALQKMKERLEALEHEAVLCKAKGDAIYERYAQIEEATAKIKEMRREGKGEEEINKVVAKLFSPTGARVKNNVLILVIE